MRSISNNEKDIALEAIRKKLVGKILNYEEIYAIMDQIAHNKLGDILTTYFAASGYAKGFSNDELFYLTKAMVETGEKLEFSGIVADKHSIGGMPGSRTTLIVTPIIAACGFTIPKSSSRAITTPSGTADTMEVLSKVEFSKEKIYDIVKKTKGCIVWGGSFHIAPADDVLIKVEEPLLFESYDKILVSIMAKKVAFGATHLVVDLPYGTTVKVHRMKDAEILKDKFENLAKRFGVKIHVLISSAEEPFGNGIGPILEARDAFFVLEQDQKRPFSLEQKSLYIASHLLELCIEDAPQITKNHIQETYGSCLGWATDILKTGKALQKMKEIIKEQMGNNNITSNQLIPGKFSFVIKATDNRPIKKINNKNLTIIAKILGAPAQKKAGIYLDKKIGDIIQKNEALYTLYSETVYNLEEAKESIPNFPIVEF
ncbi:MAG: thymidine phosphorylase [Candidatus Levyibacteriota bacterium]|nr:MAG: thymidine phosphorylase [Candidatus Levybacteria bacterium]